MNKRILIITSYFPPEIGAASNRIYHLAKGLQEHSCEVTVLTPLPNYPTGTIFEDYKGHFVYKSEEDGIRIIRLWIYASNSKNKVLRLLAMLSYSFSLLWYFLWHKIPNTVIVQSPPLLVAFTCMRFLKRKKRQLILNISDLWPIAGLELGAFKKNFSYRLLERIERFNYRKADLILGQSEEILSHVTSITKEKPLFLYRNYPDFDPPKVKSTIAEDNIKMVYAGLLGVAQGIYKLCKALDYSRLEFHIYGSGSEQSQIEHFIENNPNLPIYFHGRVSRAELHEELQKYDLTIIPLLNRIYGSVPSKIFEYARLGLPMVYFGGGEGEQLIEQNNLGWIAEAGNYDKLNAVISTLKSESLNSSFREQIKEVAQSKFDFKAQLKLLIEKL